MPSNSQSYINKKAYFDQLLTIYGRNAVHEALLDSSIESIKLHLANSNKPAPVLDEITLLARAQNLEIVHHDKKQLSRISKNAKQDQGVALDIKPRNFFTWEKALASKNEKAVYIALDRVTNPQNLGMIIRSVAAAGIDGLILPKKGCAKLDALVIKASAGALFRCPIYRCDSLTTALAEAGQKGFSAIAMDLKAEQSLQALNSLSKRIFVLGNESEGLSEEVLSLCKERVKIPMANGVDSLNVAVTASLIAFTA